MSTVHILYMHTCTYMHTHGAHKFVGSDIPIICMFYVHIYMHIGLYINSHVQICIYMNIQGMSFSVYKLLTT